MLNTMTNEIMEKLNDILVEETIELKTVVKNNNTKLTGLLIKSPKESTAPIIYIDELLERYSENNIDEAVETIIDIYKGSKYDGTFITDYSKVKDYLTLILVNKELNKDLIDNYIHWDFLDLYAIPIVALDNFTKVIKISKDLAKCWKKKPEDIFYEASNKLFSDDTKIVDMAELIFKATNQDMDLGGAEMFVVTNENARYAAAKMLDEDFFRDFANKMESDLVVIPSSIHDLIILPTEDVGIDFINAMINDVNSDVVSPEEVLSDHAYIFNRELGWI